MGKAATARLTQLLNDHLNNIHETFQVLEQTPTSSLDKVAWNQVIQMGQQVYKQATTVGMLSTGGTPKVIEVEENMSSYFNILQGFLLISHGSQVGAGPTLCSSIHSSVKLVFDSSFNLLKEVISSYSSHSEKQKHTIPQLVGVVWEACDALKKIPTTNVTAIGRAITQVAVSMKDVLREMKELKPQDSEASIDAQSENGECDDSLAGDLGNDLSPEEMKIAELATVMISDTLLVIKELIRVISGLLKRENGDGDFVNPLERLLKICQEMGVQIDEVGACIYPPQEGPAMMTAINKIRTRVDEIQNEVKNLEGSNEGYVKACVGLMGSLTVFESELGCSIDSELVTEMENLDVSK
jgi:hypothetical protein